LLATLNASAAAFQRGNFNAGEHQLGAFEKKVIELMGQSDPDLAESLVATAELIMAIVSADDSTNCNQQLH